MPGKSTPATTLLERSGVWHALHSYQHDPRSASYGAQPAEMLGLDPATVFKTLVADVDGKLVIGVVPVTCQLDLKSLAAAAGGKRAKLAGTRAAERATGYVAGGISPLGQRSRLALIVDASASKHPTIYCSAGRRGLEIELVPADLIELTSATVATIGSA